MDIQKLKHILYNVNHLCSHIAYSRISVKKIKFEEHTQVYTDVHRLLDIYICSLMDELAIFEKFAKQEDNFYISDTVYAIQPLMNYIKKFDSLRVKRNKLLAHHNRNLQKEFTPWWKELAGKRFATTNEEERMIFSTINCIHYVFEKRFSTELNDVLNDYDKEIEEYEKYIMEVPDAETPKDIAPTITEVKKRMKERDFSFTIMSQTDNASSNSH